MIALAEQEPGSGDEKLAHARNAITSHSDSWSIYGERIEYYEETFRPVLDHACIADYLENRERPIVVDLMGPSDTIASLFDYLPNKEKQGIAVTLNDKRTDDKRQRDRALDITQISGDITHFTTWVKIMETLHGKKADLIMERAAGGLDLLPLDETFLYSVVNNAWRLLSRDNGTMLIEAPWEPYQIANNIRIPEWIKHLKEAGIEARYESFRNPVLNIKKTVSSPKNLPEIK